MRQICCYERAQRQQEAPGSGSAPTNAVRRTGTCFKMANGGAVRQGCSDIDALCDAQGNFEFNAKIPNGTINLSVAK